MPASLRLCAVLAAALATPQAFAAEGLYGAALGSVVSRDADLDAKTGFGVHGVIGKTLRPGVKLEGNVFYSRNGVDNVSGDLEQAGAGLDLNLHGSGGTLQPFFLAGLGVLRDWLGDINDDTENSPYLNLGVGLYHPGETFGYRGELRAHLIQYDAFPGHNMAADLRLNFGLVFGGKTRTASKRPSLYAVLDTDGDGVAEASDQCPETARNLPVDLKGCIALDRFRLERVSFARGSTLLQPEAGAALDGVASALRANAGIRLEIAGYTDARGEAGDNQNLSERRAEAVREYLISLDIAAERLNATGYGEENPLDTNETKAGRANNRRVEFRVQ